MKNKQLKRLGKILFSLTLIFSSIGITNTHVVDAKKSSTPRPSAKPSSKPTSSKPNAKPSSQTSSSKPTPNSNSKNSKLNVTTFFSFIESAINLESSKTFGLIIET